MPRFVILALILTLVSGAGVAAPEVVIPLDSEQKAPQVELAPQIPPLAPDSRAPVAFEKIGDGRGPQIKAASAILVDAETGQILYSLKPHYRRPMASTTKVMTALLALEYCDMSENVTASKAASKVPYTSLHLVPGEQVPAKDLLTGMLIRSANDAAYAFGEHISGSIPKFSALMNARARQLGMRDTNFKNPNGLYESGHYSTAYDLALLTREAIKYPLFNEIVATRKAYITRNKNTKDLVVFAQSPFMKNYPGADGVKSGYVKQAGYCYIGSATKDGWRLLSVVLKSDNASRDSAALMDYGFANFRRVVLEPEDKTTDVKVSGGKVKRVSASVKKTVAVVVAKNEDQTVEVKTSIEKVSAPVEKGEVVGKVTAYANGVAVLTVPLVATQSVGRSIVATAWHWSRWPWLCVFVAGLFNQTRRIRRGRTTAKNTLRRRSRFSQALGRVSLRG